MGDLSESLPPPSRQGKPVKSLLIILRIKCGAVGSLLAQDRTFAAAILALLDHDRVVLERELLGELRIHQLLLR